MNRLINDIASSISAFLFVGIILFSCDSGERQTQIQPPEISPTTEAIPADTGSVAVMSGADTTIQSTSLMNSLVPELTVSGIMVQIAEAKITRRQVYPNRHIEGQMDTIITVKSDSAVFQFYRLPGKDMLQTATLSQKGVKLGAGLEVGMSAEEVAKRIPQLQNKKSIPQTILIRAEQTPIALRLRFNKNKLEYMQYDGYID